MSGKRYPEEFKIEAVKQVTDRGYKVGEVAERLGITTKNLHDWIIKYGDLGSQHQTINSQQEELCRLKAELRRVTEERDILKEAAVDSTCQGKIRVHKIPTQQIPIGRYVPGIECPPKRVLCLAEQA